MKKIMIVAAAAAVMMLTFSCYERQFVPTTGEVEVEFANELDTVSLTGEYLYLPVQMVEKSTTGARAMIEFVSGTVTLSDGTTRDAVEFTNDENGYQNGGDFLLTDNMIYISGYDAEDPEQADDSFIPSASFEIRVPEFSSISAISLKFNLTGEYLSDSGVNTTTLVAVK